MYIAVSRAFCGLSPFSLRRNTCCLWSFLINDHKRKNYSLPRPTTLHGHGTTVHHTSGAQDPTELRPPGPKAVKKPTAGMAQHTLLDQANASIANFLVHSFAASTSPGAGASERFGGAREGPGCGREKGAGWARGSTRTRIDSTPLI